VKPTSTALFALLLAACASTDDGPERPFEEPVQPQSQAAVHADEREAFSMLYSELGAMVTESAATLFLSTDTELASVTDGEIAIARDVGHLGPYKTENLVVIDGTNDVLMLSGRDANARFRGERIIVHDLVFQKLPDVAFGDPIAITIKTRDWATVVLTEFGTATPLQEMQ